jgi:hypothetical protein
MIAVTCAHCGECSGQESCAPDQSEDGVDVSICFTCAGASIFERCPCCGSAISRLPTAEQSALIDAVPAVIIARRAIADNSDSVDAAVTAAWREVLNERD